MLNDCQDEFALFDGQKYGFVEQLKSVYANESIIVCKSFDGKRYFVPQKIWEANVEHSSRNQHSYKPDPAHPITTVSSSLEKLSLFRSLFIANDSMYAKSYFNKKTSRIGYAPACAHDWVKSVCGKCQKPPIKCANCPHRSFLPLDDATLITHFRGSQKQGRGVVAIYPLFDETKTKILAVDFDKTDWKQAVLAFWHICDCENIPVSIERSRSGQGAHAWFFFDTAVEASDARNLGCVLLTKAMQFDTHLCFESYDRLFPCQNAIPVGGFGNAIALPFQGDAMRANNTMFVDKSFEPYRDQWRYLSGVKRISPEYLAKILQRFSKKILGDLVDVHTIEERQLPSNNTEETEQDSLIPFLAIPPKTVLHRKDIPSHVRIVRSNLVFIPTEGMSPKAINKIKRLAAFSNPEFYRAQAMRQPVYGKPRILSFCETNDDFLGLPRGCEDDAIDLLTSCGAFVAIDDKRYEGRPIKVKFNGALRQEQELAMNALTSYDTGILVAPTAFGKTVVAASIIARRKVNTLIILSRSALLKQWKEQLEQFLDIDEKPPVCLTPTGRKSRKKQSAVGQIGGGNKLPSGIIDIALVPALFEKGEVLGEKRVAELVQHYGMVICDECHHVPAFSFEQVMKTVKARYVYGLTATPKRSDGLQAIAYMQCGPIRYRVQKNAAASFSRIMIPRFTKTRLTECDHDNFTQLVEGLSTDTARNYMIVNDVVRMLGKGKTPLILTRRVDHAERLSAMLTERGCFTILLIGSDPQKLKQEKLLELKKIGDNASFVVVATGSYVGEGFDDDRFDVLCLAAPVSWSGLVAQYVGRLHRAREGKREVIVYDYIDVHIRMLDCMYRKRLKEYAAQGYEVAFSGDESDARGEFITSDSFALHFEQDITHAVSRICLMSADVHKQRVARLMPSIETALARGVNISVVLPRPSDDNPKKGSIIQAAAAMFEEKEIPVTYRESCPNLSIIDKLIVWYGGIGAFAFPRSGEEVLRFVSEEVAQDLNHL